MKKKLRHGRKECFDRFVVVFLYKLRCQNFYSKQINILASFVFSVYLFEGTVRDVMNYFIKIETYKYNKFLPFLISGFIIVIMIICSIIELVRRTTIAKLDTMIQIKVKMLLSKIKKNASKDLTLFNAF